MDIYETYEDLKIKSHQSETSRGPSERLMERITDLSGLLETYAVQINSFGICVQLELLFHLKCLTCY